MEGGHHPDRRPRRPPHGGREHLGRPGRSQLKVLNRDFTRKNPDRIKVPAVWSGLVADAGVEFRAGQGHAHLDQSRGVRRRRFGQVQRHGRGRRVAEHQYLNIWVCALRKPAGVRPVSGRPGGYRRRGDPQHRLRHDRDASPPFDLGRTTTHEVGHWLNLRHIWGDTEDCSGGDFVETPRMPRDRTTASRASPASPARTDPTATCSSTTWTTSTMKRCTCSPSVRWSACTRHSRGRGRPSGRSRSRGRSDPTPMAGPRVPPEVLQRAWVHSHEEDTGAEMVFRPAGYSFPRSRGRRSFELTPGGKLTRGAPARPTAGRRSVVPGSSRTMGRWPFSGRASRRRIGCWRSYPSPRTAWS